MASQILATASHVADKAKEMTGVTNAKVAQLQADTKDAHDPKNRITSDYGVKQNNTDDWLKVATEDQQGPSLLEDHFAREKVRSIALAANGKYPDKYRSNDSTTSVSQSVLSTPVVPVLLESSHCSSPLPMSHLLASSPIRPARLLSSCDSRLCLVAVVLRILFAMSVVLRSSSTLRRAIGILLETTFLFSSSRTA
jgi:hypothetical protein